MLGFFVHGDLLYPSGSTKAQDTKAHQKANQLTRQFMQAKVDLRSHKNNQCANMHPLTITVQSVSTDDTTHPETHNPLAMCEDVGRAQALAKGPPALQ